MTGGRQVFVGVSRLARFDAGGMGCFAGSVDVFMASLAPWVAITLVGSALTWFNVGGELAATEFLIGTIMLLGPPVISHFFARSWRREKNWLGYSAAFNWCQWALPVVASLWCILVLGSVAVGLPEPLAGVVAIGGVLVYAVALHWFLVRHGLGLSAWRSAAVVAATNVGTGSLMLLPRLVVVLSGLDG
jgi:hypothetical protein